MDDRISLMAVQELMKALKKDMEQTADTVVTGLTPGMAFRGPRRPDLVRFHQLIERLSANALAMFSQRREPRDGRITDASSTIAQLREIIERSSPHPIPRKTMNRASFMHVIIEAAILTSLSKTGESTASISLGSRLLNATEDIPNLERVRSFLHNHGYTKHWILPILCRLRHCLPLYRREHPRTTCADLGFDPRRHDLHAEAQLQRELLAAIARDRWDRT